MTFLPLALLLAAPVRANQALFPIKAPRRAVSGVVRGLSADGYHFAEFATVGGKPVVLKDGEILEKDVEPAGGFDAVALSGDGADVAYVVKASRGAGLPIGSQVHVDGKTIGPVYERIADLRLSPNGAHLAYAAKDAMGWRVVSTTGESPIVVDQPTFVGVSNTAVVYILKWKGRTFLYRDHKPSPVSAYESGPLAVAASPDLSRVAGILRRRDGYVVEENGLTLPGVWSSAEHVEYFNGGKDLAYFVRTARRYSRDMDGVVVNGTLQKIPPTGPPGGARHLSVVPGKAAPIVLSGAEPVLTIAGRKAAVLQSVPREGPWIGFSRSGAHCLFYADGKLRSETGVVEESAPEPEDAPVFDGENEYHYLTDGGGAAALVCGALGGGSTNATRCAKKAREMGLRRAGK